MRITLFVPCFIDSLYPNVAMSMVRIFEQLGHTVEFPENQTCCGQPPFNSGYWEEARAVASKQLEVFKNADCIVSGSGSCGAMFKVFYPELFHGHALETEAKALSAKTWEFSEFLVNKLNISDVGARFEGRATFHDGCHGLRELGTKEAPRTLLRAVKGLELVEMGEAESCCGFGGTFAVKYPQISTAMAEVKCASICETKADYVISNDSSCLMQISGWLNRNVGSVKCMHLAEVLAAR